MFRRGLWKYYLIALVVCVLVGSFFYGHWTVGIIFLPILFWARKMGIENFEKKKRRQYIKLYGEFLQAVETALATGYSLEHAISSARSELERSYGTKEEIVTDLLEIERRLKLHDSIDDCLNDWAEKKGFEEMTLFSHVVTTGRHRGGDVNRIIRQTADAIAGQLEAEAEIATMLAGKYLEYRLMCVMPLGIIAYIKVGSPDYFNPLYNNLPGILFMSVGLVVYAVAILIGKRLLQRKK